MNKRIIVAFLGVGFIAAFVIGVVGFVLMQQSAIPPEQMQGFIQWILGGK